jgi:DNA invertase Pin-like site-specific DNA recombinase
MVHLVSLIEDFKKREISFKSLCDGAIDTTTASGELLFNIFTYYSIIQAYTTFLHQCL